MERFRHWLACRLWGIALLLFGLMLLPTLCFGQVTYTYVGPLFAANAYVSQLTGSVTLAAPLAPDTANQVVTPLSYSFAGYVKSCESPGQCSNPSFNFSTTGTTITSWNISAGYSPAAHFWMGFTSSSQGQEVGGDPAYIVASDSFTYQFIASACYSQIVCFDSTAGGIGIGTWTLGGTLPKPPATLQQQLDTANAMIIEMNKQNNDLYARTVQQNLVLAQQYAAIKWLEKEAK